MRSLAVALLLIGLTAYPAALAIQRWPSPVDEPEQQSAFESTVQPLVTANCVRCHNADKKKGDLDLESLKTAETLTRDRAIWEKVLLKLRTGEMPPEGATPRPSRQEAAAVATWLKSEFRALDRLMKPEAGRVTTRRLNRSEFNNTVRDLLGVDIRPADSFPPDDSGYGFDNNGDVLSLSPVLMERYLLAAESVVRTGIFGPEILKPTRVRYEHPDRMPRDSTVVPKEYDESGLTSFAAQHFMHRFPVDGEYVFKSGLRNYRPYGSEPVELGIWIDGKLVGETSLLGSLEGEPSLFATGQDFTGKMSDHRVKVPAGDHWVAVSILRQYEGLPAFYGGQHPSKQKPSTTRKVALNRLVLDFTEIQGPYKQATGPTPESLKKVFGNIDVRNPPPGSERQIIADFARRAFRRPATKDEVERYVRLYETVRKEGDSFEEGVAVALQGILMAPVFLFRVENDRPPVHPDGSYPITDYELASRLSYFLWSSMPDEELLGIAQQGTLRKPEVLKAQVERMLKDPKSRALVDNFGGQWLQFKSLEAVKPDRVLFPDWNDNIRLSMRRETELLFLHVIREDRSILDFLDANYTFLNESLAKFYGIPGVIGPDFRKVDLSATKRGGVLTQGSVLTVTSYPTRTSPVLRGKWILENILNAPPPPPPPDVPDLDVAKVGKEVSLRQQLEVHRTNPVCASCHARMDPLGFGLENFDAIGAWREKDGKMAVDASGTLPDGRAFQGANEMKAILKADHDVFVECLTDKLLTYALGRGLERYDRSTVQAIAGRLAATDYTFSRLVLEIVNSFPFQNRKSLGTGGTP
jgi:mono/diheme cytochrome c family protein